MNAQSQKVAKIVVIIIVSIAISFAILLGFKEYRHYKNTYPSLLYTCIGEDKDSIIDILESIGKVDNIDTSKTDTLFVKIKYDHVNIGKDSLFIVLNVLLNNNKAEEICASFMSKDLDSYEIEISNIIINPDLNTWIKDTNLSENTEKYIYKNSTLLKSNVSPYISVFSLR